MQHKLKNFIHIIMWNTKLTFADNFMNNLSNFTLKIILSFYIELMSYEVRKIKEKVILLSNLKNSFSIDILYSINCI